MKLLLVIVLSVVGAELIPRQSVFQGKNLRILPLGASITWGQGSSDGNGYREDLRDLLSPAQVTYIGTQCSGDMQNGNNEGHRDYRIEQLEAVAVPDIVWQPNVVLIYAGTNDMLSQDASAAPGYMQQLVSYLVANLPHALIVVSKLFLDARPQIAERIDVFDSALDVTQLGNVMIADMSNLLTVADLGPDGEHPLDSGYEKMAQVFYNVLAQAESDGRIADPATIQFTPYCNGPPVIQTISSTESTSVSSTTSAAISQASSSITTSDSSSATSAIMTSIDGSSISSSADSSTLSTLDSMSFSLPIIPTTSQTTASVSTTQDSLMTSATSSATTSPTSTSTGFLSSQTPTNSAQKLGTELSAFLLIFGSLIASVRGL